ncbi:alpha/beta fold hydrolase [Nonomuraea aridisoli]|uniref:alpha/beta fold hydrolase n=1 Tax=Nonomuraea aridisoli TaxID=2070368 RepID=UPI001C649C7A|nr:alpha/beta fold hydrolase [Nonomuraea aridisoli]
MAEPRASSEAPAYPLLLLAGRPQTWYARRLLMPALAQDFQVVAVDPRGVGLSDKPRDGYDTGTLARDLVALMDALGHRRFAMVGHDVGMWTGYALAADHPDRLDRLAVAEAAIPGLSPAPPLLGGREANDRLWHFAVNRLTDVDEQLVSGREHLYFGHQFATKAAKALPDYPARSTRPSPRTTTAGLDGCPFPSWRSEARRTRAHRSARR